MRALRQSHDLVVLLVLQMSGEKVEGAKDDCYVLTSSRQIGQRWSLSALRHSLKVALGSELIMWSGVCRGRTSPMVAARDNRFS